MVVIEDLKITNMSKSQHGKIENPGVNIKAKYFYELWNWGQVKEIIKAKVATIPHKGVASAGIPIKKMSKQEWSEPSSFVFLVERNYNASVNIHGIKNNSFCWKYPLGFTELNFGPRTVVRPQGPSARQLLRCPRPPAYFVI